MALFDTIKDYLKTQAVKVRDSALTADSIDGILNRAETTKASDGGYDSIEIDRKKSTITFGATTALSKQEKEVLKTYFNNRMQYEGLDIDSTGKMVLTLAKGKDIGSGKALQQGIDEAMESLKDPKAVNQTMSSAQSSAGSVLANALELGKTQEASKILDQELSVDEKARSFQIAFNQGNLLMMDMLTQVGGYKPSPEMKNDKGVPLKQWLSEQAKGPDEATRNIVAQLEKCVDVTQGLSASAMAQVGAISMSMGQAMGGLSQGSTLSLPTTQSRGNVLGTAF